MTKSAQQHLPGSQILIPHLIQGKLICVQWHCVILWVTLRCSNFLESCCRGVVARQPAGISRSCEASSSMQNHNFYVLTWWSLTQGCCFNNHSSDSNSFNIFQYECTSFFSPFTGESACDLCPFGVQTHVHKWDMWAKHIFISGSLRNVHATFSSDFGFLRETFSC